MAIAHPAIRQRARKGMTLPPVSPNSAQMALSSSLPRAHDALERLRAIVGRRGLVPALLVLAMIALGLGAAFLPGLYDQSLKSSGTVRIDLPPPPVVVVPRVRDIAPETARVINAEQRFVIDGVAPARAFVFGGDAASFARAVDCLAAAAWYEVGDDAKGQRAVIQVVLNRARNPAFPRTVCGVVFQGSERVTGCQFSFTCDGSLARTPSREAWQRARALGSAALVGEIDPTVGHATHYHANYVVPYWASSLDKIAQVDLHIFYRWQGYWGTPGAFAKGTATTEPLIARLAHRSLAHWPSDVVPSDEMLAGLAPPEGLAGDATPVPPEQLVTGVTQKALRKAVVRGRSAADDRYFIEVDAATFPGSYATAAVALCRGKPSCQVFGWRDAQRMGTNLPLSETQAQSLSFYYEHRNGSDRALWNCIQVPRANSAQCLPAAPAALVALGG